MVRKSGRRAARSGRLGHGLVRHGERDAVKQLLADDPGFLRRPLMTGFHGTNTPAADRSATMGIRGRTYFLGAQKDKYFRRCEADGMRQKGERLKKLVRLVPNDGQGRFDMEAPFSEDGRGACAQGRQTMLDPFVSFRVERLLRCRNPNLWAIWSFR